MMRRRGITAMKKIRKYLQEKNVGNEEDSEDGDNNDGEAGVKRELQLSFKSGGLCWINSHI